MRKTFAIVSILIISVGVILYGVLTYLNTSFENKAKKQIEEIVKKDPNIKDFKYGKISANILSKRITITDVRFQTLTSSLETNEVKIKRIILKGKLQGKNYSAKFNDVKITAINPLYSPTNSSLFIKEGLIKVENSEEKISYYLCLKNILLNKSNPSPIKSKNKLLDKILDISKPINIEAKIETDEKQKMLNVNYYTLKWNNNFYLFYSSLLENVDFNTIGNLTKTINASNQQNPLATIQLLGEILKIEPIKIIIRLKDLGIKERLLLYLEKTNKINRKELMEQLQQLIHAYVTKNFQKPLMNFIKTNNAQLILTIYNPNKLNIGDILQKSKTVADLFATLKINLQN